ncbi:MAG: hypothetical protein GY865_03200 [candidate division Zixibacteria bacterium]|nr:hypothetical protein [candidate division Zixibacteria bacterium]
MSQTPIGTLFCDWEIKSESLNQTDFFNLPDLKGCKVLFFDPLNFANKNNLRENINDPWARENISLSEADFQKYVLNVKESVDQIRNFIYDGGLLVIRSVLPNSHITVRKKSNSSSSQYVKSVISPFFWLEEFLGKYSFNHANETRIRFLKEESILHSIFQNTSIKCQQTQTVFPKGKTEVIADNSKKPPQSVISKVIFPPKKGEIYFIPKFIIKGESLLLAKAFLAIADDSAKMLLRPNWLYNYEKELGLASQYTNAIDEINFEIEKLKRKRASLLHKKDESEIYTDLLFKTDDNLVKVVKKSLRLAGIISPQPPSIIEKANFDFYYRDKLAPNIVGQVVSTEDGPVSFEIFEAFLEKVDSCMLKKNDKAIFVANADFLIDPKKRKEWFDKETILMGRSRGICLLTTAEMFILSCYLLGRSDSSSGKAIKESLKKDIFSCNGLFRFNQEKFYARKG